MVRLNRQALRCCALLAALIATSAAPHAAYAQQRGPFSIPSVSEGELRRITTDDLARIRDIDSLSLSPDGARFAILVRQADPERNTFQTAWFVGDVAGGSLVQVGDGGEARLLTRPTGRRTGDFGGSAGRWSPDGRWLAYTVLRNGEVQLWRSRVDGSGQQQVTRNRGDVREFAWSDDSQTLLFTVTRSRADVRTEAEARGRSGVSLHDFSSLFEAINPGAPAIALDPNPSIWIVTVEGSDERLANDAEREAFTRAAQRQFSYRPGGTELVARNRSGAVAPPIPRADGAAAWYARIDETEVGPRPFIRLHVTPPGANAAPIACAADECVGQLFLKTWWSADGSEVLFWRYGGVTGIEHHFYAWSPITGALRTVLAAPDDIFSDCDLVGARILCLREAAIQPRHVAAIDIATGRVEVVADVNPEFRRLRFGRVQRIEWDLPNDVANLGYPPSARGYILYPPDYDPSRRYPIFIAPYVAGGFFRGDGGDEHPLHVYAANGFIVLNSGFPRVLAGTARETGADFNRRLYDPERGFPHLSMLMESTVRGLDAAIAQGGVDSTRVGVGGVSHGAFIPMYMLQNRDRLAAVSVGSPGWTQLEYYFARLLRPTEPAAPGMWPETREFWSRIDLADHIDAIEAPILFHFADQEIIGGGRLLRRMSDARLPYDAFSFPDELHLKWQPAHRLAIYRRNLDWFRFWLQDIEDPDQAKAEQYERWRQLRELQCRNRRSLRDYCNVVSAQVPIAH